jgi:hypothetical protein
MGVLCAMTGLTHLVMIVTGSNDSEGEGGTL